MIVRVYAKKPELVCDQIYVYWLNSTFFVLNHKGTFTYFIYWFVMWTGGSSFWSIWKLPSENVWNQSSSSRNTWEKETPCHVISYVAVTHFFFFLFKNRNSFHSSTFLTVLKLLTTDVCVYTKHTYRIYNYLKSWILPFCFFIRKKKTFFTNHMLQILWWSHFENYFRFIMVSSGQFWLKKCILAAL